MKTKIKLVSQLIAAMLLSSCSSPFAGPDQLDIGLANAVPQQHLAQQQASMAMAGRGHSAGMILVPMAPVQRLAPIR